MESSVPMMLPKGIVVNTSDIYQEVARYPTVPADKVWEYWHVYTTTNKRLQDPTARRLENFWWHVWGSDRRFLSGRALARLYEDISIGPTIVPLQGPPNRWEGPNALLMTRQMVVAHLVQERDQRRKLAPPPTAKPSDASVKSLSSSNFSKPAAPHPILKKSRGPSSSGPRPTARFVSPHESADEADKDGEFPSSGSTATTGLEMPLTSSKKKPSPAAAKKFVVATSAARRRPVLPRKTSPQSPIPTTTASLRDGGGAPAGSRSAAQPRPVSPIPERTSTQNSHESEGAHDGAALMARPSAEALGKRPALPPIATGGSKARGAGRTLSSTSLVSQAAAAQPRRPPVARAGSYGGDTAHSGSALALPKSRAKAVGSAGARADVEAAPAMQRAQSHNGYGRYSESRNPSQGLFTGATASTTNVAAQGTIIDQAGSLPSSSVMGMSRNEPVVSPRPAASSLLESRLTPTQPGPSASLPMGRTRSQLTLLLEREKARIGDKSRSRS